MAAKKATETLEPDVSVETEEETGTEMEPLPPGEELVGDGEGGAEDVPFDMEVHPTKPDGWCAVGKALAYEGTPCPEPPHEGGPCSTECEHFRVPLGWCSHGDNWTHHGSDNCFMDPDAVCTDQCPFWVAPELEPAEEAHPTPDKPRPDYAVIDRTTGEIGQLSLEGAVWEAYKVAALRWSASGGEEERKDWFEGRVTGGELKLGAIVRGTFGAVVTEYAPVLKKGEPQGKLVLSIEVLHGLEIIGQRVGKVEAAQNVDGEAKVLEETGSDAAASDEGEETEPVQIGRAHV
jgi:hypothetical protein